MQLDFVAAIGFLAMAIMLVSLFQAVRLKSQISGGMVGKRWSIMIALVVLFAAGYLILPFIGSMAVDTLRVIVSLIFFFGAIYVLITIRLIHGIIKELAE